MRASARFFCARSLTVLGAFAVPWYTEVGGLEPLPRKKKSRKSPDHMVNVDSTIKQLQTQLVDPQVQQWLWNGSQGVRQRVLQLNFKTLRNISQRLPLINAIINTRTDQILPFCRYAVEDGVKGFTFELERSTRDEHEGDIDDKEIMQLSEFFEQTGFEFDSDREDDFADYLSMMVRDLYEIDQVATEIQRNRLGEPVAFWALDGATIMRVSDEKRYSKDVRFVQMIEDKVYNEFKSEDVLFDYRFKRSDIKYRGYGYSPVEQAIDVITTLLFGYNYIRDQLVKDKMPKGFISVMGDVSKPQLDSIRNYWYAAMSGAGGQWAIPILPSGKDGVGVDFKNLGQSNKDMEYHKTLMFVSAIVAAVFSIDLMEMGIKTDDTSSLIGESAEPRIQSSKSRGLASMLSFMEQHVNKVLRKITTKYRFKFVGLEQEDQAKKADIRSKQLATWRTIDEIREEDELEPFDEDWSKIPLHPQAVQIYMEAKGAERQEAMQEQGGGMGGMGGGMGGQYDDEGDDDDDGEGGSPTELFPGDDDYMDMDKSLKSFRKRTDEIERRVRIVVE